MSQKLVKNGEKLIKIGRNWSRNGCGLDSGTAWCRFIAIMMKYGTINPKISQIWSNLVKIGQKLAS